MTSSDPGSVVLVRFPFTDLTSTKKRPALIVSPPSYARHHGDIVVLALTSQDQYEPSLALDHWQRAGLPKATWIKPLIGTLASTIVDRQLGRLDPSDHKAVRTALSMLLTTDWR